MINISLFGSRVPHYSLNIIITYNIYQLIRIYAYLVVESPHYSLNIIIIQYISLSEYLLVWQQSSPLFSKQNHYIQFISAYQNICLFGGRVPPTMNSKYNHYMIYQNISSFGSRVPHYALNIIILKYNIYQLIRIYAYLVVESPGEIFMVKNANLPTDSP